MDLLDSGDHERLPVYKNHLHGKVSFALFLIYIIVLSSSIFYITYKIQSIQNGEVSDARADYIQREEELRKIMTIMGFSSAAALLINIAGIGWGVSGVFKKQHKKILAWIGLAGNSLFFFLMATIFLMAVFKTRH